MIISFSARPVQSQGGIEAANAQVQYTFGEQILFQAQLIAPLPIKQASILFRETNEEITRVEPLEVGADGVTIFVYDASQNAIAPFGMIVFWYQATLADDQTYTSAPAYFRYDDNRFPWRETSSQFATVHWYDGDDGFGQAALDRAGMGLRAVSEIVPVASDGKIDIYVYSNAGDLQGALTLGGETWVAGHANPKIGVAMVSISPGASQTIEMETQIPHEIAHIMLYRDLGEGYDRLPVWLNEGIAAAAELYPSPEYAQALTIASENGSLLPIAGLCDSFPSDSARAFLAYAEAQSFVRYLYGAHGSSNVRALVNEYASGSGCELGASRALGMSLGQLESNWRETTLGENALGVALRNLSPFILLMALALLVPLWGTMDMLFGRRRRERR
jgi:hypothetical protein